MPVVLLVCPYCGALVTAGRGSALGDETETGYYHRHNAQYVPLERLVGQSDAPLPK